MKPAAVVDYVDETRKVFDDIGEGFEGHRIDGLYFECLHEAFRFGVVVRITAAAHRADEALHHQNIAIELGSVLRAAIGVMYASRARFAVVDCGLQSGECQPNVDRPTNRIADDTPGPGVENDRHIDKASGDGDVGYIRRPGADQVRRRSCPLPDWERSAGRDRCPLWRRSDGAWARPRRRLT